MPSEVKVLQFTADEFQTIAMVVQKSSPDLLVKTLNLCTPYKSIKNTILALKENAAEILIHTILYHVSILKARKDESISLYWNLLRFIVALIMLSSEINFGANNFKITRFVHTILVTQEFPPQLVGYLGVAFKLRWDLTEGKALPLWKRIWHKWLLKMDTWKLNYYLKKVQSKTPVLLTRD